MLKPERVLLTTSTFPMDREDKVSARFVLDLARHLSAHVKVVVLAPAGPTTRRRENWDGVTVYRFPYWLPATAQRLAAGEGMVATMRASWFARMQAPFFVASQWAMLPGIVRREGIDLVNPHWIVPQGFTAVDWRRHLKLPMVITAHGADVAWLGRSRFGARLGQYVFDRADGFIADSEFLATRTEEIIGRPIPHTAIPMGVATSLFQPREGAPQRLSPDGAPTLLFVGKLVPKKGVPVLLDALHELRRSRPSLRLLLIGGGPLEGDVRAQIARLGLEAAVELRGWVKNDELPGFYAAADVVCIPSVQDAHGETEGTPVVLQEAMASGAVVVASRTSGIVDVIRDGENGWSVPPNDSSALAAAIGAALDAPADLRARMQAAARATSREHSWERVAERFLEVFQEAAAGASTR